MKKLTDKEIKAAIENPGLVHLYDANSIVATLQDYAELNDTMESMVEALMSFRVPDSVKISEAVEIARRFWFEKHTPVGSK